MADAIEDMRQHVASLLKGIDRYNPENLPVLERYVEMQAEESTYDLEANLAVLKLYQFNPHYFQTRIVAQILLMALANMPHADFTLCKCLIDCSLLEDSALLPIVCMSNLLETCQFSKFWEFYYQKEDICGTVSGFKEAICNYICNVVSSTYQTIHINLLAESLGHISENDLNNIIQRCGWSRYMSEVFITNQEGNVKTKNIKETISFDSVAGIMSSGTGVAR